MSILSKRLHARIFKVNGYRSHPVYRYLKISIQCVELHTKSTVRRAAEGKNNPRILAIITRELVAAEACYHKSCYRDYTQNVQGTVSSGNDKKD